MLVTDDDAIADRARVMSLHGISRDAWKRYAASGSWYYEIEDAGYKYNMTDMAAALGLVQLERAEELLAARRAHRRRLHGGLRGVGGGRPPRAARRTRRTGRTPGTSTSSAWSSTGSTIDRAAVIDGAREAGIGTSVHFIPLHLHPYYRRRWGTRPRTTRSRRGSTSA